MSREIQRLDVVATTISGSVKDWGKIPLIQPLFEEYFPGRVRVHVVDSHEAARQAAAAAAGEGSKAIVSAGGAGTFNCTVQGVLEGAEKISSVRLGFLRKGSADLIGKALGVSDDVETAVGQIAEALLEDRFTACDVVSAQSESGEGRNFVGFGGLEVIGDIPYFTENPWTKYYKGLLGYLFGDLGPFKVGTSFALAAWMMRKASFRHHRFRLLVDGQEIPGDRWISILLVNGDLGPDMPFCRGYGLGRGEFYLIALRDRGWARIPGQLAGSFSGGVQRDPARHGLEIRTIHRELQALPLAAPARRFRINVDGLRWSAEGPVTFRLRGKLKLLSARKDIASDPATSSARTSPGGC